MSPPAARPWRRALRDLLVVLHIVGVTAMSLPAPLAARQAASWRAQDTVEQIEAWTGALGALGFDVSTASVTALAKRASLALLDVRDVVIAPYRPYSRMFGTGQGWHMFGVVNNEPARLRVQIQSGIADFETVHLGRDRDLDWLAGKLDHERMRAAVNPWSWGESRGTYKEFCRWIAAEAKRDFPDAHAVRCAMMVARLPTPEQLRAGDKPPERARWEQTERLYAVEAAP